MKITDPNATHGLYYQQVPPEIWYGSIYFRINHEEAMIALIAINKSDARKVPTDDDSKKLQILICRCKRVFEDYARDACLVFESNTSHSLGDI